MSFLGPITHDLVSARRTILRRPLESLLSLALMALGIGLNVGLLTVLDVTLLRELPVAEPERVAVLRDTFDGRPAPMAVVVAKAHAERSDLIEAVGVFARGEVIGWTVEGETEGIRVGFADSTLFTVLGVVPELGRVFEQEEDLPLGVHPVALLAHDFWRGRLSGRREALDDPLRLSGRDYRAVGVLPAEFPLDRVDVWLPFSMSSRHFGPEVLDSDWTWVAEGVARLAPGVSLAAAEDGAKRVFDEIAAEAPWAMRDRGVRLESLRSYLFGRLEDPLRMLLLGAGLVLVICGVNAAALHLVRSVGREPEARLRLALGASRLQVGRQLVLESLAIGLSGGALGAALAAWLVGPLASAVDLGIPRWVDVGVRGEVALLAIALSALVGLSVGVLPALRLGRADAGEIVRGGARQTGDRRTVRHRSVVVIVETALAVALMVLAGLGARSLYGLMTSSFGFSTERLTTMRLNLKLPSYDTQVEGGIGYREGAEYDRVLARRARLLEQVRERVETSPGVAGATFWGPDMLGESVSQVSMFADTMDPQEPADSAMGQYLTVGPGGLATLGIPLLRGREFSPEDRLGATPVVILSRRVAEAYWPQGEAIGRYLLTWAAFDEETQRQVYDHWLVVGIAADAQHRGRSYRQGDGSGYFAGDVYFPFLQEPGSQPSLLVRTRGEIGPADAVREIVRDLDPEVAVYDVRDFEQRLRAEESLPRFAVALMGFYALVASALAFVGIYGVLAFTMRLRVREMAIRRALGADAIRLRGQILREGLTPVAVGVAIGLLGATGVIRVAGSALFETGHGGTVYALVSLVALSAGAVACLPSAMRAAREAPSAALRSD